MTDTPTNGQKRARSASEPELVAPETAAPDQGTRSSPRMVLMHLSALLSCEEAIAGVCRALAAEVLPEDDLPKFTDEAIIRSFTMSPIVLDILGTIIDRKLTPEEATRTKECYWRIYHNVGWPLLGLAPRAKEFLEIMKRRRDEIKLAVISQNPPAAAEKLASLGVGHLVDVIIPRIHIQAHTADEATATDFFRDHWQRMIAPSFATLCRGVSIAANNNANNNDTTAPTNSKGTSAAADPDGSTPTTAATATAATSTAAATETPAPASNPAPLHASQALVVSCGLYDLTMAQASGAQTCWVRRIQDETAAVAAAQEAASVPLDMVIADLGELVVELFGEGVDGSEEGSGGGVVGAGVAAGAGGMEGEVEEGSVEEAIGVDSAGEDAEVEVVKVVTVAAIEED
ncbi:hypothetical protein B0I37DRAFT_351265 [Chaetomium sp. MPI-CAGE-AT-0009]|nr:hypothetical protein B0I37DRAFT_351265 [Chaetomium sp. MPI-CAGE-AT-0009]